MTLSPMKESHETGLGSTRPHLSDHQEFCILAPCFISKNGPKFILHAIQPKLDIFFILAGQTTHVVPGHLAPYMESCRNVFSSIQHFVSTLSPHCVHHASYS